MTNQEDAHGPHGGELLPIPEQSAARAGQQSGGSPADEVVPPETIRGQGLRPSMLEELQEALALGQSQLRRVMRVIARDVDRRLGDAIERATACKKR